VCKLETLREAYLMARKNNGAPGIDGVTFGAIEQSGVEEFLLQIRDELVEFQYLPLAQQQTAINQTATVVYHEVGGLVPKPSETTSDDLHKVRVDEATVYNHHPKAYPASDLSPVSKNDLKTAAWKDSVAAAREALGKPDIGQHLILYDPAINFPHVPWMQNAYVVPSHAYGGFINVAGGGDIPKGDVVNPLVMQNLAYREILWKRE